MDDFMFTRKLLNVFHRSPSVQSVEYVEFKRTIVNGQEPVDPES